MPTLQLNRILARDIQRFGRLSWWLLFRCLPALILAALSLLVLGAAAVRAQASLAEVEGGQLILRDESGQRTAALAQRTKVDVEVTGMIAIVTLEQQFRNRGGEWMEGVYAFPLPEQGAVRHLEMRVGERRIVGEIRERAQAQQIYREARAAGKKSSLVEQQRPNLFTSRVANIAPGESVSVRLEYVQQVNFDGGRFSLRLPTTITPRYIPGISPARQVEQGSETLSVLPGLGWAKPTDRVVDADQITPLLHPRPGNDDDPRNALELRVRLDMGMPLTEVHSPYHDIALSRRAGIYEIVLARGVAEMDRDFELQWTPVSGSAPSAAFFIEKFAGEYYGLLLLVPPGPERAPAPTPREIVFVVDTSGSMGGVSIRQARQSLARALQHLRPEDRFNIIQFNSSHHALFRRAAPATRHNLQLAGEYVRHLRATGGTEMMPALQAALAPAAAADEFSPQPALRQVIFITDGAVGNEQALFEVIVRELGPSRLFTVGIGSAPNSWFMRKAAEFGRGTYTYISDVAEVGATMDALFRQLSFPIATSLTVDWPDGVEPWPSRIPDLYLGEPLLVAVRLGAQLPDADLLVRGRVGEREWATTLEFFQGSDPVHVDDHRGVAAVWARSKISALLDMKAHGKDDDWVRDRVLPLALEHRLMSPYTSFVAVEQQPSRPDARALDSNPVPNTRPRGQSPQTFAYPHTATTAAANVWLGSFLLLLALFARAFREEEQDG
ncbi:marine proteobacterial sortase target protein [Seongchinamella unica]|uniref:Marine proteobacterial sortase target protein n=1 Tax=Seongchinamella unica TaxID=2547392 RepID=A0A4R5LRV2_9GAMM|nr:marine proteobacterial sortase target protein [Seongchinamella unica]TDG13536.1 marine proteobacterial sortase target protein [Seongchinamella unica]